jgi:hypothetical protein
MRKRVSGEQIALCVSLPGRSEIAISNHSFDRFRELKAMGEIALAAYWQMGSPCVGFWQNW